MYFFGNTNETINILSFSDLFLLTSSTESFGLAALEAMASSVPVISTNAGGLPEVNINGVSGYMSNVGDIDTPHLLKIGQDGTGSYGSGTTAEISDVRIWNRVIATNEVNYCRSDLLANWKLDEGTGTIAQDAAGSNDGTLQGGASWTSGHNHNGFVIPLGCPTDVVEEDVVEIRYVPFASKYLLMALIAVLISVFLLRRG